MADLKNSVAILLSYVLIIFGIANISVVEDTIINFSPAFFILMTLAVVSAFIVRPSPKFTIYIFLGIWAGIYILTWAFYWRDMDPIPLQVHGVQFLLVEIGAGLAFDVGRHINQIVTLFEGLTASTFPNRTLELREAEGRISAELTRSRRYHHSMAVVLVELEDYGRDSLRKNIVLERDILSRFAVAKIGQIINDCARETDLIIRDDKGRFVILCPETTNQNSKILADRIEKSVSEKLNARVFLGSSSFPDEALTFDDLVHKASERLSDATPLEIADGAEVEAAQTVSEKRAL